MAILTEAQINIVRDQIVADGGELLGVDQETKTFTFAFADVEKMLALVSAIKGDKILSRLTRVNSKFVDGRNILTVDPS